MRMTICFFAFCCLFIVQGLATAQEDFREWTSAGGKHSFEAQLLSFEDGKVELKGRDGKVKKLDLKQLSSADQEHLAEVGAAEKPSEAGEVTAAQKEKLKELGLKLSRDELSFLDERDLKTALSGSLKTKKNLLGFEVKLQKLRLAELQIQNQIVMLKQKDVQLNAGLAGATGARENNKFIAMLNANNSQIQLLAKDLKDLGAKVREGQSFVNKARDEFVKQVLEVRKLSDSFDAKAEKLAKDEKLLALVGEIEESLGQEIKPLAESRSLARSRSNLAKLESIVLTDTIQLTDDGSGTFEATVSINGYKAIELVVDSGASLVCMPAKMAEEIGVEVGPEARTIQMTIADGSVISGKLIILESVRMGKFKAENVECAILGPEAVNAPGLLGMSFLGNFKFELDASKGELKMMTIESEGKK